MIRPLFCGKNFQERHLPSYGRTTRACRPLCCRDALVVRLRHVAVDGSARHHSVDRSSGSARGCRSGSASEALARALGCTWSIGGFPGRPEGGGRPRGPSRRVRTAGLRRPTTPDGRPPPDRPGPLARVCPVLPGEHCLPASIGGAGAGSGRDVARVKTGTAGSAIDHGSGRRAAGHLAKHPRFFPKLRPLRKRDADCNRCGGPACRAKSGRSVA